jgi:hypothetical protein
MTAYYFVIDTYTPEVCNKTYAHGQARTLVLRGKDGQGTTRTAHVEFHPGEPNGSVYVQSNGVMVAVYPLSDWDVILDLLRNEKPVYFHGYEPTMCLISTSSEPVGEEES